MRVVVIAFSLSIFAFVAPETKTIDDVPVIPMMELKERRLLGLPTMLLTDKLPNIRVIDADKLEIGGERVHLAGIDAPEYKQICTNKRGEPWRCGLEARNSLFLMTAGGTVRCHVLIRNRQGETEAICGMAFPREIDIGETLIRAGLALNDRNRLPDYSEAEDIARKRKLGLHSGQFVLPWLWREGVRLPME